MWRQMTSTAVIAAASMLVGCGPPAFVREAENFNAAMGKAHSAYVSYNARAAEFATRTNVIVSSVTYRPLLAERCDTKAQETLLEEARQENPPPALSNAPSCSVMVRGEPGGPDASLRPINDVPANPNGLRVSEMLAQYAASMAAIAGSNDLDTLNSSVEAGRAAAVRLVQQVAASVGKSASGPASFGSLVDPISQVIKIVTIEYLEHKRIQALRQIVTIADDAMPGAQDVLSRQVALSYERIAAGYNNELSFLRRKHFTATQAAKVIEESYDEAVKRPNPDRNKIASLANELSKAWEATDKRATDVVQFEAQMKGLLLINPARPYVAMAEAHAKLKEALNKKGLSIHEANKAISNFLQYASILNTAIAAANGGRAS